MTDPSPAELDIAPARPSPWRNLSFVWLVPILALAVSLGVAWRAYTDRGVLIEITFENASGVIAGETTIRFRDVVIGTVEDVGFTDGLSHVLVHARVDKEVAPYLDEDAEFWVVRPQVSTRGISGLSTVLSGVYIEGAWDEAIGTARLSFLGIEAPPLVQPGRAGKRITLRSSDGRMLSDGAPVFFRGIEVGRIERPRLTVSGDSILADAFIEAPHDRRLTAATRFWDTSGFAVSFGPSGLTLDVESLASLVAGGVEFDDIYEGGEAIGPGYVFDVFLEESDARRSLFARSVANAVSVSVPFDDSISGLSPGAAVEYGGLEVGEVTAISAEVTETEFGPEVRLLANLAIEPSLLGLPRGAGEAEALDFLEAAVAQGLRARLATANLFSAALIVELVTLDDAPPATFDRGAEPFPILPSVRSELPDFTATAEGVLERINALPIEELLQQAIGTLASVEDLARAESTLAVPQSAVALLEDTRAFVNDEATKALPGELRTVVADLSAVVADLKESGAVDSLAAALERASAAADNIATASADMPALLEDFRALAAKLNALQAEELVDAATRVLDNADRLISSEEAQALPPALTGAIEEVRAALAELREGGAVDNLSTAMERASAAADNIATASVEVPALVEDLRALAAKVNALEAEELVDAATRVLDSADKLIGTDEARALPPALTGALEQVRAAVSELREGGVVENTNATLASAREAAEAVAEATAGLPELSARLERLVAQAEALVAAYGDRSNFNSETLAALREVRSAARAVAQLARTIERNPNALIMGR